MNPSKQTLLVVVAFAVTSSSCRKSTLLVATLDASESEPSVTAPEVDAGFYEHVFLTDMGDAVLRSAYTPVRLQDQPIEFVELFDAPPNGKLAPEEKCLSPYGPHDHVDVGFPTVDRVDGPPCFRLVAGKIDPASVIPHEQMRVRVRGVFHMTTETDASDIVYHTTLALDAFDPLPDPAPIKMSVAQIVASRKELEQRRVSVDAETFTMLFEGTPLLTDIGARTVDGSVAAHLCTRFVTAEASELRLPLNRYSDLRLGGRIVISEKGCPATILIESAEHITPEKAR